MDLKNSEKPGPRIFYGYYIVAASFVVLFLTGGALFALGVTFKPLMAEFGWSRSGISSVFFLYMAIFAGCLTFVGRIYDRFGPKWLIAVSGTILAIGYGGMFFINAFWQYAVTYGILTAIGISGTTSALFGAVVSKWFDKGKGLAISLAIAGQGCGQFVMVPILTYTVHNYGWRISYLAIGFVLFVVIVSLALFVFKGDPDDLGYKPLGHKMETVTEHGPDTEPAIMETRDMGLKDAMKTGAFWLFLVFMFICGSGDFLVSTHLINLVTDHGVSAATAGHMMGWFGLMSLVGVVLAGPASDLIGNKIPIVLTFALRTFLFLMVFKYQTTFSFWLFSLGFGFTLLITAPLTATLVGKLFGFSNMGILCGFIVFIHHLGGGLWGYMGGAIFDKTGSYQTAIILSAVMAVIAIVSTVFIREKRHYPAP
ncbi:MFS transporter [Thermodesulfobacteriota bacterium]